MDETGPTPARRTSWLRWLSSGGGVAVVGMGLEGYRRFLEIRDAAMAKAQEAGHLLEVGVEKAREAGVLQIALDSCRASEQALAAALKTCGG